MCGPRKSEKRRGNRQTAESVVCCDYQWLSCGRVLDPLQHAKQGKIIAAELLAAGRNGVVFGVACCVHRDRLVQNSRAAIPGTSFCDPDEHCKYPQPQSRGGEELAMAVQYPRHNLFDATH